MSDPVRLLKSDLTAPPEVRSVPILDRSRDAEFSLLKQHAQEYLGRWLALDGAKLLGSAPRLRDLLQDVASRM